MSRVKTPAFGRAWRDDNVHAVAGAWTRYKHELAWAGTWRDISRCRRSAWRRCRGLAQAALPACRCLAPALCGDAIAASQ